MKMAIQLTEEQKEAARLARNAYQREYRKQNRELQNKYLRKWRAANKDKVKEYNAAYWARKAAKYGIVGKSFPIIGEKKDWVESDTLY